MPEIIAHDYALRVGGSLYSGWTEMELTRSLERMAGEFRVKSSNAPNDQPLIGAITEGVECIFEVNGIPVLEGYVDRLGTSYSDQESTVEIAGRDKVGDLLDCAATINGPFEFNGMTLDRILTKMLKPFDIPVTIASDIGEPFKRMAIQPGEKAFDFIERACRFRSVLPISDGVGGLVITKPGNIKSAGKIVYGSNVLSCRASRDFRDRFSLYVVKGQSEATENSTAEETSSIEGRAVDREITRYRPTVITSESQGYAMTLKERAAWQASFNKARARRLTYSVAGWFADGETELWKPNSIVSIIDPKNGLSREMLIVTVTLRRSDSGTTTDLEVADPKAFDIPAEKEDDDTWGEI